MINRRHLLAGGAALGVSSAMAAPRSRQPYAGPNIVIVRFGGGVRRRETIEPAHTSSPYLLNALAPRGTLFANMEISDLGDITQTSHAQGTLYLLTGRYHRYRDIEDKAFNERFEPAAPTLFEYLRKTYSVPSHECLIVNGEDRKNEEYLTFSNHDLYGVDYRCHTLSLARFKRYLFERHVEEGVATADTRRQLALLRQLDYRGAEPNGQGAALESFWARWRARFGDSGLATARGDALLTQLSLWALEWLRPKLMMINYQDPDYVHWGNASHYSRGISIIDRGLEALVARIDADPAYRGNTVFVVVPDCGRDDNRYLRVPFQHHFNSPSAHRIWALLVGPHVPRGQVRMEKTEQIDVAATVAALMATPAPAVEGEVLL